MPARIPHLSKGQSVATLLLGAMLGAGISPVLAAPRPEVAQPAVVQTRAASCAGLAFHPLTSDTHYDYKDTELYMFDPDLTGLPAFFVCNPDLPDRAVVTAVQFTVLDNSKHEVRYCGLDRSPLKPASAAASQPMASLPRTGGTSASATPRRLSTTHIAHATVDRVNFGYWLQCQLTGPTKDFASDNLGIYGADVVYRISAANG
jgi:hypothetical protein